MRSTCSVTAAAISVCPAAAARSASCECTARSLQAVREVAGARDRPPHRLLLVIEQRVEVVDERLDLGWIRAFDARLASLVDRAQPRAQAVDG